MEAKGLHSPLSKCECLTLDTHFTRVDLPGIASVLESSPNLETLILTVSSSSDILCYCCKLTELANFNRELFWTSQKWTFKWLMLHLKTVKFSALRWETMTTAFLL